MYHAYALASWYETARWKQQEVSKKLYLDCKAEDKNDLESNDHSNYDIQHHIIGKLKKNLRTDSDQSLFTL